MPHKEIRKIIRVGKTSYAVILPKTWLEYFGLDNRNRVQVISNDKVVIQLLDTKDKQKKDVEDHDEGV